MCRRITVGVALLSLAVSGFATPVERTRPNVVLILVDDLNDWVGFLAGHPQVKTPHLDRLAARGMVFANAHCAAPLCGPSRTALLTGRAPTSTGIYDNDHWFRRVPSLRDLVSLPQALQRGGYDTIGVGKLYHTHAEGGQPKSDYQQVAERTWVNYGPRPAQRLNYQLSQYWLRDWGSIPDRDEEQPDFAIASYAVERLGRRTGTPFFLNVGFFRPHVPFYASPRWMELYPRDAVQVPPDDPDDLRDLPASSRIMIAAFEPAWVRANGKAPDIVQAYLACVSFVDGQIGRVLDAIEAGPNRDDTWIILTSDHGFHLGEKDHFGKTTLWERSTRVPLVIAGPGVARGATCAQPVSLLDLFPTLTDLTGAEAPPGLDGRSLVPLLRNPNAHWERPVVTTWMPGNHAVRSGHWRYIRYRDGAEELYDHRNDPGERTNLAGDPQHAEVLAEHRRWLPRGEASPARSEPARRP